MTKKKILILCNLSKASPAIYGLCKYLPNLGYTVFMVTPYYTSKTFPRGPKEDLKRYTKIFDLGFVDSLDINKIESNSVLKSLKQKLDKSVIIGALSRFFYKIGKSILYYPDVDYKYCKELIDLSEKIILQESIDLIFSTGPPHTYHIVAKHLKQKYPHLKWVSDFRDPWSDNQTNVFIKTIIDRFVEPIILKTCDGITTVSKYWAELFRKRYPFKKVFTVHNGFDPYFYKNSELRPASNKFVISYTGTIYFGLQDPTKFLVALGELINENKINKQFIAVNFYGSSSTWLKKLILKYNMVDCVQFNPPVLSTLIPKIQSKSNVLLVFDSEKKSEKGVIPLKFYEALGARRTIFVTGKYGSGELKEILELTNTGYYFTTKKQIKDKLLELFIIFIKSKTIPYKGNEKEIIKYSYKNMTKKYSAVFDKVLKNEK